jgi:hypothetical protein
MVGLIEFLIIVILWHLFKKLAVQNERGPRQPFPDRHMNITGSFGVKSEVKILMLVRIDIRISINLVIVCSSGTSDTFVCYTISINTII